MFDWKKFVEDVATVGDGDYVGAFKMLGFVVYIGQYGADSLLTGHMISLRTYYRYVEIITTAGWGCVLAEVRAAQALQDYAGWLARKGDLTADQVVEECVKLAEGV